MGCAYRCHACGEVPQWRITRRGDAVVAWACGNHLAGVCDDLQREGERTELVVTQT